MSFINIAISSSSLNAICISVLLKKKLADESTKRQELQTRLQHLQNELIKVILVDSALKCNFTNFNDVFPKMPFKLVFFDQIC